MARGKRSAGPSTEKKSDSDGEPKLKKTPSVVKTDNADFNCTKQTADGKDWNLKISSWNINGIRAWMEKGGQDYIDQESPDIFCLNETKCPEGKIPSELKNLKGYKSYFLSGDTDGYSGVGLMTKETPIDVKYGIGEKEHDKEGRVITAEYEKFFIVACYVPNAGKKLVRLDYRQTWDVAFRKYLNGLKEKKHLILCGDLNVAHKEIDLKNPKTNKKNAGFTKEERDGFTTLLEDGYIDSFRHLYPDVTDKYSFWTYMMNARGKNVGWRLDYFVISDSLEKNLCDSVIRSEVMGSDHCPIVMFLSL